MLASFYSVSVLSCKFISHIAGLFEIQMNVKDCEMVNVNGKLKEMVNS